MSCRHALLYGHIPYKIFAKKQLWAELLYFEMMEIVLIGTGNVATVLTGMLQQAGHQICQILGRNADAVNTLAGQYDAEGTTDFSAIRKNVPLYIIAVSDTAIPLVLAQLPKLKGLLVHTAGAVSMRVLASVSPNYGILYPLQSLRKEMPPTAPVPILTDASTPDDLALLDDIARSISPITSHANDEQRQWLHLAAIFANNFTNLMYGQAFNICAAQQLPFALLQPLMQETVNRLTNADPKKWQTGPAARNDSGTIAKHLALLQTQDANMAKLYEYLSQQVSRWIQSDI